MDSDQVTPTAIYGSPRALADVLPSYFPASDTVQYRNLRIAFLSSLDSFLGT
jgi:hypothetical protein